MAPRAQRAYRACIYCRQRKSKCEFDTSIPGWSQKDPQCQRCSREGRRCVLAPKRARDRASGSSHLTGDQDSSVFHHSPDSLNEDFGAPIDDEDASSPMVESSLSAAQHHRTTSVLDQGLSPTDRTIVDGDLQNPGDALTLLARVANDRDLSLDESIVVQSDRPNLRASRRQERDDDETWTSADPGDEVIGDDPDPILHNLGIPLSTARILLTRYRDKYHPFFPIAHSEILDVDKILDVGRRERHLQTAILTIASKHDEEHRDAYQKCLEGMNNLIASAVFTGPIGVEAVEALLLLAEWAPPHRQWQRNVGTGEEDRAAWMQVGLAVRLAYLQGLDASSFETPGENETQKSKRRRIAWAACYMSDRLISTRIGKAFWSRGPGPSSTIGFADYEPFKLHQLGDDDYAAIFQANLDLTQLFSNAHDILYASLPHRDRLFRTGEYAKYIDDFRHVLANWHAKWNSLNCSANIKCSLLLSYEYLRLYITAFAFQATLSRIPPCGDGGVALTSSRASFLANSIAGTGDARFIYEAVSAAKSLLSTFNSFVHPKDCLRYMPIRYYLYAIYAAVFLYKARATGVLHTETNNLELENTIYQTITRLKESSIKSEDPGNRYAKLLALLWGPTVGGSSKASPNQPAGRRKVTGRLDGSLHQHAAADGNAPLPRESSQGRSRRSTGPEVSGIGDPMHQDLPAFDGPIGSTLTSNAFSWRDLESVGQYATSRIEQAGTFAWPELFEGTEWNDVSGVNGNPALFPEADQWGLTQTPF